MKVSTGVQRLDELLDGGIPATAAVLVYGPQFVGKETLTRLFLLEGLRSGVPTVCVLTNASASDVARELADAEPRYAEFEKAGLVHFVDTYSRAIGADEPHPNTEFLDGALNLNAIALAVGNAERKMLPEHMQHRLVFDSLSTLVAYSNVATTFRFLQILVGKTRRAGATTMLLLDAGMHTDAEVQMFKHLMDGFIETRSQDGKHVLTVEGVGVTETPGWVEYAFTDRTFELTGSFATGRIR